jgi:GntR family transcriptional repressor for pyruvate dehydrogenase complex
VQDEIGENAFKAVDPERQGTTAEEIAVQLSGMLHRGELKPGDRLPPEREIAKMLGVSRPTLRAGISFLAAVGG